jgi:uncharacterized protein YndB with AHSA1/START domain
VQLVLALLTVVSSADVTAATVPEVLSAPVCVACQVDGDRIRGEYSADDWNTLTAGKVLTSDVTDGGSGEAKEGTVQAAGIILRPPSRVWTTLVDFASRPRFQPGTKDVRVVRVEGNRVWVTEHLRFFLVDVHYTVINTLDPARGTVRWVLDESVEHDIGGTRGSWQLTPLAAGHQTLLTYRAWIDTGRYVPAFIQQFLLQRSLPNVIGGIRDEVERRMHPP